VAGRVELTHRSLVCRVILIAYNQWVTRRSAIRLREARKLGSRKWICLLLTTAAREYLPTLSRPADALLAGLTLNVPTVQAVRQ
jgi:hypothetical protein